MVLQKILHTTCPHYHSVCGSRWPSKTLLEEQEYIADLAYLKGVWMYSQAVTEGKFPKGLFRWPPTEPGWEDFVNKSLA